MKRPALAEDLVPISEFRADLARWLQHVEETGRPVVVTQRGRATGVLVTPEALDELEESTEVVRKVLRGLRQAEAGELVDEDDVWAAVEDVIAAAEGSRASEVDDRSS